MGRNGAKLELTGFNELLEAIQKAQGNTKKIVNDCMEKEADIAKQALEDECHKSKVADSVTNEIRKKPIKWDGDTAKCSVGWEIGNYDPKNLSAGFKAIFINYGTPKRTTSKGYNRGEVEGRGFIKRAKTKTKKLAKAEHKAALTQILKDLTK